MHSVTYFFALSESAKEDDFEALSPSLSGVNTQAIFLDDDECTFDTVNLVVPVLLFKLAPLVVARNGSFATIETSAIEEGSSSSSSSSVRLRK